MEAICYFYHPSIFNFKHLLAIIKMKFLIAIGSKDYSGPTLELGMRIAKSFNAAVDIVYVGERVSAFSTAEVILAQENLENWELDRKGVDVLHWAYEYLFENEYINLDSENSDFNMDKLIQTDDDRCEVHLKGRMTQEVGLILRNGDIIQQLRDEVKRSSIDCTIIGGSGERQMAHDLVQFIDSSIFVVKNYEHSSYVAYIYFFFQWNAEEKTSEEEHFKEIANQKKIQEQKQGGISTNTESIMGSNTSKVGAGAEKQQVYTQL